MLYIRRSIVVGLGLILVLAHVSAANAEMIFRSVSRSIAGGGSQLDSKAASSDTAEAFTDDLLISGYVRDDANEIVGSVSTTASQASTLSPEQIRGLGRGSGFGSGPGEGRGQSEMSVEFEIEEHTTFVLNGQLRVAPHGSGLSLNGSTALIRVTGPNGVAMEVLMDEEHPPNNFGIIDFSGGNRIVGDFSPGVYLLEAASVGLGSHGLSRCADFEFSFTAFAAAAVPEPGGWAMCLCSLILLAKRRSRIG